MKPNGFLLAFKKFHPLCIQNGFGVRSFFGYPYTQPRSIMGVFFVILLGWISNVWGQEQYYTLSSVGDRGVVELEINNPSTFEKQASFGPEEGEGFEWTLNRFQKRHYLLQCVQKNETQKAPRFHLTVDERKQDIPTFAVQTQHAKHIIWVEQKKNYRSGLERSVKKAIQSIHNMQPVILSLDQFPTHLSSLARTSLIMMSLKVFQSLSDQQRMILKASVAGGATLLIGTGDMTGNRKYLSEFSEVVLGEVNQPNRALLNHLMRVPSYRTLYVRDQVYPLILADGVPILTENTLGMGKVRVLAVKLNDLTPGIISDLALQVDQRPLEQLTQWLDLIAPPLTAPPYLLTHHLWLLLLFIPFIFSFAKGRLYHLSLLMLAWVILSFFQSPLRDPTLVNRAYQIYLPLDQGAMVFGQIDLSSFIKGTRLEAAFDHQISLVSTETQGACLIHEKSQNSPKTWWMIESSVGERQRFKYMAYLDTMPRPKYKNPETKQIQLPTWPRGPWSGLGLRPLSPLVRDLPMYSELDHLEAWQILKEQLKFVPPPPLLLEEYEAN